MTIKNTMAESQHNKHQNTNKGEQDSGISNPPKPSDLAIAMAIKLSTTGDINIPKQDRSESDDEPTIPLEHKLTDAEIAHMLPPIHDKDKKKKKKKLKEESDN